MTDRAIRSAIAAGADTVDELGDACGAGTACGGCAHYLEEMLEAVPASSETAETNGGDVA